MALEYNELEPIIEEVLEKVRVELIRANAVGTLDIALDKYGVDSKMQICPGYGRKGNTILVLGDLAISKKDLSNLFRIFKVTEKTFEFVEYDDITNFNFGKLIANTKYTDIFVGPVPHKAMDIGAESGVIEYLNNNKDIIAKVTVLRDNSGELKINKKTFRNALEDSNLLNEN